MIISSKGKKPAELQQKIIVKCLSYNLIISPVWEQCPGCCRLLHTAPCLKDRHRPDTGWSVETIHTIHSLHGHQSWPHSAVPTAAAANLPTRGMDKLCYVCLINYLSHRDVDQSIDSYFIMDNGSLSPSILCFKLLINPCCTFGQAQMTDGVLTDQIFLQLSLTFQKGPIMI